MSGRRSRPDGTTSSSRTSSWIVRPDPAPGAAVRLFCFPFAGGGTAMYRGWSGRLPPDVELCAVQLPGRESRFGEAAHEDFEPLLAELVPVLASWVDRPYAFFGHSMGAVLAWETACRLRDRGRPSLLELFVSARAAPGAGEEREPLHELPDEELVEELRELEGTPEEVLAEPELLELYLPLVRKDFAKVHAYEPRSRPPLSCPITAFGGRDDDIEREALEAWESRTEDRFRLHMFPGGHFFLREHEDEVIARIVERCRARLTDAGR